MLKIGKPKGKSGSKVTPGIRLWKTADGKLVNEGDPDAVSLYCSAFASVPAKEFDALVKASGAKAEKAEAENKEEKKKAADKSAKKKSSKKES